jgi:hypothetical protein
MALGPWEGRAVAFVLGESFCFIYSFAPSFYLRLTIFILGCGIGVLLRMVWVMAILTYRMVKGDSDESGEYAAVCDHYRAEEILVPPPQYTYDEKSEGAIGDSIPVQFQVQVHVHDKPLPEN